MTYQWQINAKKEKPDKKLKEFKPSFGIQVVLRDKNGKAKKSRIDIYSKRKNAKIFLLCKNNSWGKRDLMSYRFEKRDDGFYSFEFENKGLLEHKDEYLIKQDGKILHDPATDFFSPDGRSVFWDFGDKKAYKKKHKQPDRINRSVKILQTDLPGLIHYYRDLKERLGSGMPQNELYRFIAESGVISKIKELGFNTIQFLPLSQSIDGDKWSFRYLTPYIYSINNRWGDPDDFLRMIDEFHKHEITVIHDFVISHVPVEKFSICGIRQNKIGIHQWRDEKKDEIWLGEDTSWGTRRYEYADPTVRRFITEAALKLIKNYAIDGFRIDNVDGIMRHGAHGDGRERHGGREALRELATEIYSYDPHSYIHLESHYFKSGQAKHLVQPLKDEDKALGATAYTSSRLTYYFHKDYMPKAASDISPWKIKDLIDEKEWGASNSTVADFHNHDAAAGLMASRATGSYAYDALILGDPELHHHAIGKIKVMEAIISFGMEGRTLDLLQTFLLQTGTFEHDSSIHWYFEITEANKGIVNYKRKVNEIMDFPAFWPINFEKRRYVSLDEKPKSLVIHRSGGTQGSVVGQQALADLQDSQFIIYINMASHMLFDYVIPVPKRGKYEVILNSDEFQFSGSGRTDISGIKNSEQVDLFEFFNFGIRLGSIAPYQVLVLRKV